MKIQLQGADNARDFRGIVNTDGKKIISKDFIRSNHLHDLSEEDIRILKKEYGLVKIIDLRTKLETEQKPDTKIEGVEHIHIPVFDESAIGITHEADTDMQAAGLADIPDMGQLYVRMVEDDYSVSQLSKILNVILEHKTGAILWHCTEGKDRCGLVSALFLTMLGVDIPTITDDYLRTNLSAIKRADEFFEKIVQITGNVEKAIEVKSAFLANEKYLNAALNAIHSHYASVQEYIEKRLGIERGNIEMLKRRCLEG